MKTIGITGILEQVDDRIAITLNQTYCQAVVEGGANPIIIPLIDNENVLYDIVSKCDGVIFSGGADVNPKLYNTENTGLSVQCSDVRDEYEEKVFNACRQLNKPIFGICRGHQFINVMFDGTLYQDECEYDHQLIPHRSGAMHKITNKEISFMHKVLGLSHEVNSYHHQSVREVGKGFEVVSVSEDGVIEAMQHTSLPIITVQFHPEKRLVDDKMVALMKYFVDEMC